MSSADLGSRTSPAVRLWSPDARPLVLVPTGSTEQHGPHLPLATDSLVAEAVARAVAERFPAALVAPTVSYGSSGEHQHPSFPGTISIGEEALAVLLVELTRSLSTWAGRIVFVNAHGGNVGALARAVVQLRHEQHAVAWVACGSAFRASESGGRLSPDRDSHAGRAETSLLLHLAPELVRLDLAEAGSTATLAELLPALRSGGVAAVSPNGVLGDPRGATAKEGATLFAAIVDEVAARIGDDRPNEQGRLA